MNNKMSIHGKELQETSLPESQRNLRDNTLGFIRELQKLSEDRLNVLTQFIVKRCFLIVVSVSSPNLDSVYRIFSVLNSRGLDLSYPDILKSEIIRDIPEDQKENYATKWEEFAEYVYPRHPQTSTAQDFIDKTLIPYARALNNIVKTNYQGSMAKEINTTFKWLNQLDHQRWIPPALYYFIQNRRQPDLVSRFLTDLERLTVSFMIRKVPPYKRFDQYYALHMSICPVTLRLKTIRRHSFI
jgi:hypothetical protein